MKISAPSRSEETVTVPTPSGADDEEIFDDSEDSVPSLARGWPAVSSGLLTRGGGEFFGERHGGGIEAMENVEKIRSAAGDEADASDILLDEFLRVDADDFAAGVEERAAAVAGIDGSVGLNPGAGTGVGKSSDGADDAFRDAEEHGVARIADGQNVFALVDAGGVGEGEMRKVTFADGAFDFGEGDVEIGIDMNDIALAKVERPV